MVLHKVLEVHAKSNNAKCTTAGRRQLAPSCSQMHFPALDALPAVAELTPPARPSALGQMDRAAGRPAERQAVSKCTET